MEKIGNVDLYMDDEEIIEILSKLPSMEDYDNLTILEYLDRNTRNSDFGTVVFYDLLAYTLYKFDKHQIADKDAGLIMTISRQEHSKEQLQLWQLIRKNGVSFSDKIFKGLVDAHTAHQAVNEILRNK